MNKTFQQLLAEARELQLDQTEKADLKQRLLLFSQDSQPLTVSERKPGLARLHYRRSLLQNIKLIFIKPMPIIIALLILLGGGTSFAAEKSLPGDTLYPVKIHINEQVRDWLAVSPQAQAQLENDLAAKRLEEAEKLGVEARLNGQLRQEIETNFRLHTDHSQALIGQLQDTDAQTAAELSSELETNLKTHDRILLNIEDGVSGESKLEIHNLAKKVKEEENDSENHRVEIDSQITTSPAVAMAAEGKQRSAQNKIAEVKKFIENRESQLGDTATAQAKARLQLASDLLAQGSAKLAAHSYVEAFVLFGKARAAAQEAKLLVRAKVDFEIRNEHDENRTLNPSPSPTSSSNPGSESERPGASIRSSDEIKIEGDEHGGVSGKDRIKIELGL